MNREIITLPKERWKGVQIPLVTRSDSYYDVEITPMNQEGCAIIERREVRINLGYFFAMNGRWE